MNKVKVRCLEKFIDIPPSTFNIKIYIIINGGWSNFSSFVCKNCGEIYVAENYNVNSNHFENKYCVKCSILLSHNLAKYPEFIFYNGKILSYKKSHFDMYDIEKSIIKEFNQL